MLPETKAFLDQMAALNGPEIVDLPVCDARAAYAMQSKLVEPPGRPIARVEDFTIAGPANQIAIRLYDPKPDSDAATPAMVFYHGGGFVIGNLETHDSLVRRLVDGLGIPAIAVDYRLAPEHPFPAAAEDALAAARWASESLSGRLGRPVTQLVTCGDSAGGSLAIIAAQQLGDLEGAPIGLQVPLYPGTDWLNDYPSREAHGEGKLLEKKAIDFFVQAYNPNDHDPRDPLLSPIFGPKMSAYPPCVLAVAELDPLHDEGIAYAEKLKAAGVPVTILDEPGLIHGYYTLRGVLPTADKRTDALIEAIQARLDGGEAK